MLWWPRRAVPRSGERIHPATRSFQALRIQINDELGELERALPVLRDVATPSPRTHLVSQSINGSFAYREGSWKLALCRGSGGWSAPKPGSAEEAKLPEFQLYDLAQDLGETRNLIATEPERATKMRAALEGLVARGRSTPGPDQANDAAIQLVKKVNTPGAKAKAKGKAIDTDK